MISRIDHVSIAVKEYEKAFTFFRTLFGAVPGASGSDGNLKFRWEILSVGDLSRLELLTPAGPGSFLDSFLEKKPGGVHHITCETPDIHLARQTLEEHRIPYFGFNDHDPAWKELFIHPRDAFGVLIQIAEFRPEEWVDSSLTLPEGRQWAVEKKSDSEGGTLTLAHPGGGTAGIDLDRTAVRRLIRDLEQLL